MGKTNDWLDFDQLAEEKVRDALKPPSMYKVILVNDDYTPMEFVIDVLQKFFSYDVERATQLMLAVRRPFAESLPPRLQKPKWRW